MCYVIENINNKFVVKKVINGTLIPVSPIFRKLELAQDFAESKGYKVEKIGDLYEII